MKLKLPRGGKVRQF